MSRRLRRIPHAILACLAVLPPASGQEPLPQSPNLSRPGADAGATRVRVALIVADIDSIDSANQVFEANIVVVLRWHDPRLAHDSTTPRTYMLSDIWNPELQCLNLASARIMQLTLPKVAQVDGDGTVLYRQRYLGSFSQPLDLRDFPFDRQRCRVHFIATDYAPSDIEFVPEPTWVERGLVGAVKLAEDLSLPGWSVEGIGSSSLPYTIVQGNERAGWALEFTAKRSWSYFVWRMIAPVVLIVMMSWMVFWISPTQSGTQVSVAVTSMLSIIAFQLVVNDLIPPVSYMTRMDVFLQLSTLLVFLALVEVIVTSRLADGVRVSSAQKIDAASRIAFPVAFLAMMLASFFL